MDMKTCTTEVVRSAAPGEGATREARDALGDTGAAVVEVALDGLVVDS